LISDRQNLAIAGRWNPAGAGVRQHLVAGIQPAPESVHRKSAGIRPLTDQIPTGILPDSGQAAGFGQNGLDPAGSGRIWPKRPGSRRFRLDLAKMAGSGQTFLPESDNGDRTLLDSGDICQTLIFAFRNFFVPTKHRKIFSRKSLKMISSKSFYDRNYFTLKQTEYKNRNTGTNYYYF
jgi:hypothetical protein